jgi:hypothetical protein
VTSERHAAEPSARLSTSLVVAEAARASLSLKDCPPARLSVTDSDSADFKLDRAWLPASEASQPGSASRNRDWARSAGVSSESEPTRTRSELKPPSAGTVTGPDSVTESD